MRHILFTIVMSAPLALFLAAITVLWSVVVLRRHGCNDALRRALLSLVTFGSVGGGKDGKAPDLSVPGTLGTALLGLAVYAIVKQPVQLPVFGYAMSAACGFATAGLIAGYVAAPRLGVEPKLALTVAFLCAFFGVLGSRLFYVVEFWDDEFADQPARVVFSKLDLQPGDELVTSVQVDNVPPHVGKVTFTGQEKTIHDVVARVNELRANLGVAAKVIEEPMSEGSILRLVERGFSIDSVARGSRVTMQLSGSALRNVTPPGTAITAQGESIPWTNWFAVWRGGLVYYGGMVFGTAAVLLFVWFNKIRPAHVGDLASAVGGFGVAWGRVGCFLNGCCYGRVAPADAWYAIRFPPFSPAWQRHAHEVLPPDPWDPVIGGAERVVTPELAAALTKAGAAHLCQASGPVHAVQLYAIALDVLVGAIILGFVVKLAKREGQTFFLWFILYAIIRFIIEHFRGDHFGFGNLFGYPLTPSQRVALITFPFALAGFIWVTKKGRAIVPLPR